MKSFAAFFIFLKNKLTYILLVCIIRHTDGMFIVHSVKEGSHGEE